MSLRVGSLFAGVGGFDMALETVGMEVVWQVEKDKQARSVLRKHWPDVDLYEDVHDVGGWCCDSRGSGWVGYAGDGQTRNPAGELAPARADCDSARGVRSSAHTGTDPGGARRGDGSVSRCDDERGANRHSLAPVDVICGGFPCQDYSVAGKRGGLAGDRGGLWWQMHRIISEFMPTWVIGENVPGLVSSNGGRDFLTIVASLVQLGYGVTWATLDSQYFGVAQRRRRLFIVGHSGGEPRPEILALSEGLFGHPAPSREAGEDVAGSIGSGSAESKRGRRNDLDNHGAYPLAFSSKDSVAAPLTTKPYADHESQESKIIAFDTTQITSKANVSNPKPGDPCHPLAAGAHAPAIAYGLRADAMREGIAKTPSPDAEGRVRLRDPGMGIYEEMAPTLDAGTAHGIGEGSTVPRRLTPRECERLQAWPDNHVRWGTTEDGKTVELADGPRYRMCGNGVTSSVVEWIGRRIMSAV